MRQCHYPHKYEVTKRESLFMGNYCSKSLNIIESDQFMQSEMHRPTA